MSDTPPDFNAGVLTDEQIAAMEAAAEPETVEAEVVEEPAGGRDAMKAEMAAIEARAAADDDEVAVCARPLVFRDREWKLVAELPAVVVLDVGSLSDPALPQGEQFSIQRWVIVGIIHPPQRAEWRTFLRRARPIVTPDDLADVLRRALETIFGNPTE